MKLQLSLHEESFQPDNKYDKPGRIISSENTIIQQLNHRNNKMK